MKRMSKFVSVLMVVAMLFILLPVSALGAGSADTAKPDDHEIALVLLTTETTAEEEIASRDVNQPYYSSPNPKTGVNTRVKDAFVAGAMILSLVGLAVAGSKQEDEA